MYKSKQAESEKKDDDTDEWGDFLDVGETGVSSTNFVDKTGSTVVEKDDSNSNVVSDYT